MTAAPPATDAAASAAEDTPEVEIHGLAAGGDGVGRLPDGRAVFVPWSAPGDRVRIRISESKRRYARGEIIAIEVPSPQRVAPRCRHFGECGGCAWQHIDYPSQLEAKRDIALQALRRIGGLREADAVQVHASPSAYGYRSRARLIAAEGGLGYRKRATHTALVVRECPVLVEALEQRLEGVSAKPGTEVELFAAGSEVRISELGENARWSGGPVDLPTRGNRLRVSAGVFAQANALLRDTLAERVIEVATQGIGPDAAALELHAGAGFFTVGLGRAFASLVAIESGKRAAEDLSLNLAAAGLAHVQVVAEPVESVLEQWGDPVPDVIVLDPPRTGLPRTVAAVLAAIGARRIVYLSCDPATLARDLAVIADVEPGYRAQSVEIFDLFPQTPHVETLVVLERG